MWYVCQVGFEKNKRNMKKERSVSMCAPEAAWHWLSGEWQCKAS